MQAILIASIGYFLVSFEAVVSKFLLSGRIKSWRVYIFYVGLLSLFSWVFAPFGLHWFGWNLLLWSLVAGMFFFSYLAFLYQALEKSPASGVYILSGTVSVIGTFFLARFFLGENMTGYNFLGLILLLLGGTLISLEGRAVKLFPGYGSSILAGVLLAISLVLLKFVYEQQNFISGYVYTRMGIAIPGLSAMLFPAFRKEVLCSFQNQPKNENTKNFLGVVGAKAMSGLGTLLIQMGIFAGSVTVVNALVSVQYLFTFILSIIATVYLQNIFKEDLQRSSLALKFFGVILVIWGIVLVGSFWR